MTVKRVIPTYLLLLFLVVVVGCFVFYLFVFCLFFVGFFVCFLLFACGIVCLVVCLVHVTWLYAINVLGSQYSALHFQKQTNNNNNNKTKTKNKQTTTKNTPRNYYRFNMSIRENYYP